MTGAREFPGDIRYHYSACPSCGQVLQNIDYGCARHQITCGYPLPTRTDAEIQYGAFRVVMFGKVLKVCGMDEAQATTIAEEIGATIQHLKPETGEWRPW